MLRIIAALKLTSKREKRRPDAFELRLDKIAVQSRRPISLRMTS